MRENGGAGELVGTLGVAEVARPVVSDVCGPGRVNHVGGHGLVVYDGGTGVVARPVWRDDNAGLVKGVLIDFNYVLDEFRGHI